MAKMGISAATVLLAIDCNLYPIISDMMRCYGVAASCFLLSLLCVLHFIGFGQAL
jgi:hypothetical protein